MHFNTNLVIAQSRDSKSLLFSRALLLKTRISINPDTWNIDRNGKSFDTSSNLKRLQLDDMYTSTEVISSPFYRAYGY